MQYQRNILIYLSENFSLERALEIEYSINRTIHSLELQPYRGTKEKFLIHLNNDHRFILHKESRNFEIKIIYTIDEQRKIVYITDFFPSLMHPNKLLDL